MHRYTRVRPRLIYCDNNCWSYRNRDGPIIAGLFTDIKRDGTVCTTQTGSGKKSRPYAATWNSNEQEKTLLRRFFTKDMRSDQSYQIVGRVQDFENAKYVVQLGIRSRAHEEINRKKERDVVTNGGDLEKTKINESRQYCVRTMTNDSKTNVTKHEFIPKMTRARANTEKSFCAVQTVFTSIDVRVTREIRFTRNVNPDLRNELVVNLRFVAETIIRIINIVTIRRRPSDII